MTLKAGYVYADRWALSKRGARPVSENTFYVYDGVEETGNDDYYLEGRPVILKLIKYGPGLKREDIFRRREALGRQVQVVALEHFMLPEPLDYCAIPNDHTPEIAGTELALDEPLLVYAYAPGETLRGSLQAGRQPMPPVEAMEIILKVTEFLSYLHQAGYSHIAINPDHFLYHRKKAEAAWSLRVLGLGKIAPIDPKTGFAQPYEPPALPARERPYTLAEALAVGRFGLSNEWHGLAFLLVYLVSGECPSAIVRSPSDAWPLEQLETLPLCAEVRDLLREWLTAGDRPFSPRAESDYLERLVEAMEAQRRAAEVETVKACDIGVFVDFANLWRAFRSGLGGGGQTTLDFDAIAAHYAQEGEIYKFAAVPEFYTGGRPAQALLDLERADWDIERVQAPEEEEEQEDSAPLGMDEKDDSALVQAANNFLTVAKPRRLVLISNDGDYAQLVERARFRGVPVDVIFGHDPSALRQAISAQYLRRLQDCGAQACSIYTFPFVFADETVDLVKRHRLPDPHEAKAAHHKELLWALVREGGREATDRLLQKANDTKDYSAYDLVRALEKHDRAYYPFCAGVLLKAADPVAAAESLRRRLGVLDRFDARNRALLEQVYAIAGRDAAWAKRLADAAEQVEENWDVLNGHLEDRDLVGLFAAKKAVDPQLRQMIAGDPARYRRLRERFAKQQKQFDATLAKHGVGALVLLEQHGGRVFSPLEQYGEAAFRRLSGGQAEATFQALEDKSVQPVAKEWYDRHGDLRILDLLSSEPALGELIRRAGIGAAEVYDQERDLGNVEQVVRLSTIVIRRVEEGYPIWRMVRGQGLPVEGVITSLGNAYRHPSRPFRREIPQDEFQDLVLLAYHAHQEEVLPALLNAYAGVGRAVLWAYRARGAAVLPLIERNRAIVVEQPTVGIRARMLASLAKAAQVGAETEMSTLIGQVGLPALDAFDTYGPQLFPLVHATGLGVVALLARYPERVVFSSLQRYGQGAYELLQAYGDTARDALIHLEAADLASLLADAQAQALVQVWHGTHGDLQALDLMAAEPHLLSWASGFGRLISGSSDPIEAAQKGAQVLTVYASDPDLARLDMAMRVAAEIGLPLDEAGQLLRNAAAPVAVAGDVITGHAERILKLPALSDRTYLVHALCRARTDDVEADLSTAYDQLGLAAAQAYERFGNSVFGLARELSQELLLQALRYPQAYPSLLRYRGRAYSFVQQFAQSAVDKLVEFERFDLSNVLSEAARPVLQAWHQAHHNLDVVNDLLIHWGLMPHIRRAGLRAVYVWRFLWQAHRERAGGWLEQHSAMLLNPVYDYNVLIPLVHDQETFPGIVRCSS